tara:strand:- start:25442 stop:25663 length:222 start_codon:yes stop_codon:yes gene_type:complete
MRYIFVDYFPKEFAITISEMGLSPFIVFIIISFSLLFIFSFLISSKNMDGDGIMSWMMKKPKDWIGFKDEKID